MQQQAHDSELKAPIGIYILAVLFLLAPLGNIFFSFAGAGIENWYHPDVFFNLLSTIPLTDWVWLGGIFIAGIALLLRHKMSWLFAVIVLFAVLIMNSYRAFTLDEALINTDFVRVQILISILVTFSVLIIAFYARYPYLDRRQQWVYQTAHRHDTETQIKVQFGDVAYQGQTTNLSTAGARIRFDQTSESLKHETSVNVVLTEVDNLKIESEIIDYNGNILRVKFKNFGWDDRAKLEAWLKSRKG